MSLRNNNSFKGVANRAWCRTSIALTDHYFKTNSRYFTKKPGHQIRTIQCLTCMIPFGIMVIYPSKELSQIQFKSILGSKFNQLMRVSTF